MKTKTILLLILFLIALDQAVKLIIYNYFFDYNFDIIPGLLEFTPVFNDKHSYVNVLLDQHLGVNMDLWIHLLIFLFAELIILTLYGFFRTFSEKTKLLDLSITFQIAGLVCALVGNLIWQQGTLDFIYLKPLFVFDLKDVYVNCFIVLFFIYLQKNKEKLKNAKLKDIKSFALNKLRTAKIGFPNS